MSDYREMMHQMLARRSNDVKFVVAALYKFVQLDDAPDLRAQLQACCDQAGVSGTILLAHEGINGTIAAPVPAMEQVLKWLQTDSRFDGIDRKSVV